MNIIGNKIHQHIITHNKTVLDALSTINNRGSNALYPIYVIDDSSHVIGSLTDGDIRRALIEGASVNDNIQKIMCRNFKYLLGIDDYLKIKQLKSLDLKLVPLVSADMKIIDFIDLKNVRAILPLDAVIMAGGKGTRLRPHTNNVPKPMLDLNGEPVIAHNIDRLIKYGVKNFYISVNYMKECIKEYIHKHYDKLNIEWIEEDKFLGTIGSIKLVKQFVHNDILLMNADILTNINLDDFYYNYKETKSDMLVATFDTKVEIPYAVLRINGRRVESFVEKPTYTYYSNAGIYLLNRNCIDLMPNDKIFDATDLMDLAIKSNKYVCHFPILGYWLDVGTVQNYFKAKEDIKYVKF
ncbi:MAG: NTP transferase domain-containing protein [Holosporaceae bacterium]|jgi:dTDP-glucose pyrophosphorylase|nr:NTP transferase domain-containing protein [Holosporaceae bacterium]